MKSHIPMPLTAWVLALTLSVAGAVAQREEPAVVALRHSPTADPDRRAELWALCEQAAVTDLLVRTFHDGQTIYPSNAERTFPQRAELGGRDLLREYIDEGHARGVRVHAWVELLRWGSDDEAAALTAAGGSPETLKSWRAVDADGNFPDAIHLSPAHPDVLNRATLLCLEIGYFHRDLDGIHLDEVRYPDGGDFSYDASTVSQFTRLGHPDPRANDSAETREAWRRLCEEKLTALIDQISLVMRRGLEGADFTVTAATGGPEGPPSEEGSTHQNWRHWLASGATDAVILRCPAADPETLADCAQSGAQSVAAQGGACWIDLSLESSVSLEDRLAAIAGIPLQGIVLKDPGQRADPAEIAEAVTRWLTDRGVSPEIESLD